MTRAIGDRAGDAGRPRAGKNAGGQGGRGRGPCASRRRPQGRCVDRNQVLRANDPPPSAAKIFATIRAYVRHAESSRRPRLGSESIRLAQEAHDNRSVELDKKFTQRPQGSDGGQT